jgi:hypothetical protein
MTLCFFPRRYVKDCLSVADINNLVNGLQATVATVARPIFQSLRWYVGGYYPEVFTWARRSRGRGAGDWALAGWLMSYHRSRWAVLTLIATDPPARMAFHRGPGVHYPCD